MYRPGHSHPTPCSAHRRLYLTSDSTSRIGFFVCTFCKKLSTSAGIRSPGGLKPAGELKTSLMDAEDDSRVESVSGSKSTLMRAFAGYLFSKTSQVRTVSELVLCGGIWRKSFDGSSKGVSWANDGVRCVLLCNESSRCNAELRLLLS